MILGVSDFWTSEGSKMSLFGHFWSFLAVLVGGLRVPKGSLRGSGLEIGVRWELSKRDLRGSWPGSRGS